MTAERLPAGLLANETVQWSAGPLIEAARCGGVLEPDQGRPARVIEDQVPDRDGNRKNEPVLLVTGPDPGDLGLPANPLIDATR